MTAERSHYLEISLGKQRNMKKYRPIYALLLLLIFIYSCNGQNKGDQPKDKTKKAIQSKLDLPEIDPYFTESIDINSFDGPRSITRNIIQDKKGNFWFATWEGIIHYDVNCLPTGKPGFTNYTNKEGLRRYRVFTLIEDTKGNIWFGTIGAGVYLYDGKKFTNITTKDGLVHNAVKCIIEDKAGNVWFGTQGGLSKYDGSTFTNFMTEEGLIDADVNSIAEDENGNFWLGTRGNTYVYDGEKFTEFISKERLPFNNVRSIIEDRQGNIWFGGNDGLWSYKENSYTNFTKNFVGYIYEDTEGNIWTNTAANKSGNAKQWILSRYDKASLTNEKILPTKINAEEGMFFGMIEDKEGNIWVGTLDGVYQYNGESIDYFRDRKPKFKSN